MSAHCTTTAHRLWLALLVTVVLIVFDGTSPAAGESPTCGCEPEIRPVFAEPGDGDPDNGRQAHGDGPALHGDKRIHPVTVAPACRGADPVTLIRGPPDCNPTAA